MEMLVNLKENSYPIYIEKGAINSINEKIKTIYKGKRIAIITDDIVASYYKQTVTNQLINDYEVKVIEVEHGEKSKNFNILPSLYQQLLDFKLTQVI